MNIKPKKKLKTKRCDIKLYTIILKSVAKGIFTTSVLLFIFSAMLKFLSLPHSFIDSLATAALACGVAVISFSISKAIRKNGMLLGLLCSLAVYGVLFILSLIFKTLGDYPAHFIKFVILVLTSMIFGIIGVNRRCKNEFK